MGGTSKLWKHSHDLARDLGMVFSTTLTYCVTGSSYLLTLSCLLIVGKGVGYRELEFQCVFRTWIYSVERKLVGVYMVVCLSCTIDILLFHVAIATSLRSFQAFSCYY